MKIYTNELVRAHSFIQMSWSELTQISKLKLVSRRNSRAIWNQSSYESFKENGKENLYK